MLVSIAYVSAAADLDIPSSIYLGEKSRNETTASTFTIMNTGNVTLTNIIAFSDFNAKFNASGFDLTVNKSSAIHFNATIPQNSPTGNTTIGSIYFRSNEYNSSTFPVRATVKGGLSIEDLDVRLTLLRDASSETDTDVVDDTKLNFGDDDNIGPGSSLEFDFRIENLFLDEEEISIDDVSVLVTIKEIDDEEDIDEESDSFDIDTEEKRDISVTLKIPLKVKQGTYDIEILVRGEDEDGVEHKVEWNLEMELEKESHDIYIQSAYLTKDRLSCSRVTSLKTEIFNLGKREEDDVKIEAKSSRLNLNYEQSSIVLSEDPYDDDNEYGKTIPITIGEDVRAGTYPIDFNVYIKGSILFVTKKVNLIIEDCKTEEEEDDDEFCTKKSSGKKLSLTEAKQIASDSNCAKEGPLKEDTYMCNEVTGTWWVDIDLDKEGCSPACVVNVETKKAEINWRCTGAVPEEKNDTKTESSEQIPILGQKKTVTEEKEPLSANKVILGSLIATAIIIAVIAAITILYNRKQKTV